MCGSGEGKAWTEAELGSLVVSTVCGGRTFRSYERSVPINRGAKLSVVWDQGSVCIWQIVVGR